MSEDILGSLVRALVTVPKDWLSTVKDLVNKLSGSRGEEWFDQLKLFVLKKPCWINGQVVKQPAVKSNTDFFESISTVVIPATTDRFVAKEKFVCDLGLNSKVPIREISDSFNEWFLLGNGKTEEPITETTLRYGIPRQIHGDMEIVTELGGKEKSETTLTEMFTLMEKQKNGGSGALITNGVFNVFYIRDQNNVLRAVGVRWGTIHSSWRVDSLSVEDGYNTWVGSRRVFSRNYVLKYCP